MPPAPVISRNPLMLDGRAANVRTGHYINETYKYMPLGIRRAGQISAFVNMQSGGIPSLTDPLFYWWNKAWNQRNTSILDVYNGPGIATATSSASNKGDTRVLAVTAAAANTWIKGQQIRITKFSAASYERVEGSVIGLVEAVVIGNDTTSYLTIKLLEDDTSNHLSGAYLQGDPAGQQHPEVHTLPESKFEDVVRLENACSTMLGAYSMTDHQRKAKMERSGIDPLNEMRVDALKDFFIDKESQFLYGIRDTTRADQLSAGGLEFFIKAAEASAGTNMINALTDTNYLASTATGPAHVWIYELLERLASYLNTWHGDFIGGDELRCYHGSEVGIVMNQMIRDKGLWNLGATSEVDEYGLRFTKVRLQNGDMRFYEHPLFKLQRANHGRMVILPPSGITQATFMPFEEIPSDIMNHEGQKRAKRTGSTWSSVGKGGFREVCGWRFNGMEGAAIIDNVHTKLSRV